MSDHSMGQGDEERPQKAPLSLGYAMPSDPHADPTLDRITRGDMASLAIKVMGLYVVAQALPLLATFFDYVSISLARAVTTGIPFVLVAGLGLAMIAFSSQLARWMLPRTAVVATEPPGHGPAQLQAIAFSVVGLLLVAWAVPPLVYLAARIVADSSGSRSTLAPIARVEASIPSLLHYAVEIGIGVWLFFGSRRLATWWWQMRHPEFKHAELDRATAASVEPGKTIPPPQ